MADSAKTTARGLLEDWANQQDSWVRSLVSELLVTRSPIGQQSLKKALEVLLAEKGLAAQPLAQPLPNVKDPGNTSGEQADLRLQSLTDVSHLNAVTTGQEIELHPALTILFGENAAGKSGYCRILKRLANMRSAEEILGEHRFKHPRDAQRYDQVQTQSRTRGQSGGSVEENEHAS